MPTIAEMDAELRELRQRELAVIQEQIAMNARHQAELRQSIAGRS